MWNLDREGGNKKKTTTTICNKYTYKQNEFLILQQMYM